MFSTGQNRLAIMHPGLFSLTLIGEWYSDDNGYMYSNTSYLGEHCKTHGKYRHNSYQRSGRNQKYYDDLEYERHFHMY